jgi:hypothetical protein
MAKKLKMKELVSFYYGLQAISKLDSPNFKLTYAVVKNLKRVEVEVEPIIKTASEAQKKLVDSFAKRNEAGVVIQTEKGVFIPPESQVEFMAAQEALNAQIEAEMGLEVEIEIHEVPMEDSMFPAPMKPEILKAIMPMVTEG